MTLQNRAKIFSPFAALRGYDDDTTSALSHITTITATVGNVNPADRELQIRTGDKNVLGKELPVTIRFDDILDLSGDGIVDIDKYLGIEKD